MSTRELVELQAYDAIYPLGEKGAYLRNAHLVGCMAGDEKKKQTISNFYIPAMLAKGSKGETPQDWDKMIRDTAKRLR